MNGSIEGRPGGAKHQQQKEREMIDLTNGKTE